MNEAKLMMRVVFWVGLAGLAGAGCNTEEAAPAGETESSDETGDSAAQTSGSATTDDPSTTGSTTAEPEDPSSGVVDEPPIDGTITWHRDVRPLVETHCESCHSPGNIAPYPMTNFDEVYALRELVGLTVSAGTMPPWLAASGCTDYSDDRSLTEEQIAMFTGWVDEGAPLGRPEDYVAPEVPEPEQLSRVDLTLTPPEPYLPQLEPDDYRCFLMDWPETETAFITGFHVEPDNRSIVHHVITYAIDPESVPDYEAIDEADEGPGYTCFGGPGGSEGDWQAGKWIGAWAPGSEAADFPEGTGLKIEPGSKVVLQIHYNSLGTDGVPDQTAIQYKIEREVEREAFMMPWANPEWLSGGMRIPAGSSDTVHRWELDPTWVLDFLTDALPPNSPFLIYSAAHHMHLRGARGRQVIKRADGSEECLLDLPRYDFNWQGGYSFKEPKVFNPGDTLSLECQWDNTDNDQDVYWGEGTGDEMCLGVYFIAVP